MISGMPTELVIDVMSKLNLYELQELMASSRRMRDIVRRYPNLIASGFDKLSRGDKYRLLAEVNPSFRVLETRHERTRTRKKKLTTLLRQYQSQNAQPREKIFSPHFPEAEGFETVSVAVTFDAYFQITKDYLNKHPLSDNRNALVEHRDIVVTRTIDGSMLRLVGHDGYIVSLVELSDNRLATSSNDQTVKIWCLLTGQCLKTIPIHTGKEIYLRVVPGNRLGIFHCKSNSLELWEMTNYTLSEAIELCPSYVRPEDHHIVDVLFLSETLFVASCHGMPLQIWNLDEKKAVKTLDVNPTHSRASSQHTLHRLSNGYLLHEQSPKCIQLWDLEGGKLLDTLTGEKKSLWCRVQNDTVYINLLRESPELPWQPAILSPLPICELKKFTWPTYDLKLKPARNDETSDSPGKPWEGRLRSRR